MSTVEIFLIALGLSMDASAVSMSNAMCLNKIRLKQALAIAFSFGLFQGIMPIIGYFAGTAFAEYVTQFDHWIAFILLGFIGGKMIFDGLKKDADEVCIRELTFKLLFAQAIATSIDALAIGVSFATMNVNIVVSASFIACVTFICSLLAVFIGKKFGDILNQKAEIFGGTILVLIGIKTLIEHLVNG
ncbi:MAG: putative rane protein [Oscillospiraceae bacterium]|jgi:putative Mn2+ efflux pump MntP|nr:putative rane protein [Oscillospiraceae bacterium]